MRTRYETDAISAEVSGFDHSTAVFSGFGIVFGGIMVLVPAVFSVLPWTKALAWCAASVVVTPLLMLPLRYSVSVLADKVVLERSWAWYVYKRVELPNSPHLKFDVWGTADWGDEGGWPAPHYCEIWGVAAVDELMVGRPGNAHHLASWLTAQARRVALH